MGTLAYSGAIPDLPLWSYVNSAWRVWGHCKTAIYINYTISHTNDTTTFQGTYGYRITPTDGSAGWLQYRSATTLTIAATGKTSVVNTQTTPGKPVNSNNKVAQNIQIGSFSFSWTRTTSAQTKTITLSIAAAGSTKSTVFNISVPTLPAYTITYNANGGTPTPNSGVKYYNISYTSFSARPVLSKCTCQGWTTSPYAPDAGSPTFVTTYTTNNAATFYAYYTKNYYKPNIKDIAIIRCNPNGEENILGPAIKISYTCEADVWKYSNNQIGTSTLTIEGPDPDTPDSLITIDTHTFSNVNAQPAILNYQYPQESSFYTQVSSPDVSEIAEYYEIVNGHWVLTEDSAIDSSKTYYTYDDENIKLDPEIQYTITLQTADTSGVSDNIYSTTFLTPLVNFPLDISANGKAMGIFRPAPDNQDGLFIGGNSIEYGIDTADWVALGFKTKTAKYDAIQIYDIGQFWGQTIRIGAGGNIIIGAGESSQFIRNQNIDSAGADAENLYLSADSSINFYSNCNSGSETDVKKMKYANGLLTITNYNNTMTIGSQNASFGHFSNSAGIPFYFNNSIALSGSLGTNGNYAATAVYCKGAYYSNGHKLLTIGSNQIDNQSIAKDGYATYTVPAPAKTGYTVIGVIGWYIFNASSSGSNSSHCHPYACYLTSSGAAISVRAYAAARIRIGAYFLYIASTQGT